MLLRDGLHKMIGNKTHIEVNNARDWIYYIPFFLLNEQVDLLHIPVVRRAALCAFKCQ